VSRPAPTPVLYVLVAILAFQVTSIIAKPVIEDVGATGAIGLRIAMGAVILVAWRRPSLRLDRETWRLLIATGVLMALSNGFIYAAFDHIPLGVAVAIQFVGPITVALVGSRRPLDLVWVGLAALGILLFTPLADASFAARGVVFALASGVTFGLYLVAVGRLSGRIATGPALALSLTVAAVVALPVGVASAGTDLLAGGVLLRSLAAAVTSNVIGFSLEFAALGRVRPAIYAILICLEPAVAAVLAVLFLDERLAWLSVVAIGFVTVGAIGASRGHARAAPAEPTRRDR